MFAARAQHVRETIRAGAGARRMVISDRFTDASYAYQGAAAAATRCSSPNWNAAWSASHRR